MNWIELEKVVLVKYEHIEHILNIFGKYIEHAWPSWPSSSYSKSWIKNGEH